MRPGALRALGAWSSSSLLLSFVEPCRPSFSPKSNLTSRPHHPPSSFAGKPSHRRARRPAAKSASAQPWQKSRRRSTPSFILALRLASLREPLPSAEFRCPHFIPIRLLALPAVFDLSEELVVLPEVPPSRSSLETSILSIRRLASGHPIYHISRSSFRHCHSSSSLAARHSLSKS